MIVGLYTSRIMLEALGIDNYGISNVVGGIVAFSSVITGSMTSATSRYITVALGEGNIEKMKKVYTTVTNAQILLALMAVVFLEVAGVWFLNTTANIPEGRMAAANWVLQISIFSLFISLSTVSFGATIVAHEDMSIYAKLSIVDVLLKLGVCYLILTYGGDRLIALSVLNLTVQIGMTIFYALFCHFHYQEARYRFFMDRPLLKEMLTFSGWNLFSNTAWVFNNQGVGMLINVFFGVAFNATRGVANSVNGCIQGFVGNFTMAFSPQITKSYAAKDYTYCYQLANRSSKFTWFLMYLFIVPVCIEANTLLSLWLVEVPPMAPLFLRLAMFNSLALASSQTLYQIIQANGNIKRYTIEVTLFGFIVFPLTWIIYYFGGPVWTPYPIFITVYFSLVIFRFRALSRISNYKWQSFVKEVYVPCIKVSIVSFIAPLIIAHFWSPSLLRFFVLVPFTVANVAATIYILGLTSSERIFFVNKFKVLIGRITGTERRIQENA